MGVYIDPYPIRPHQSVTNPSCLPVGRLSGPGDHPNCFLLAWRLVCVATSFAWGCIPNLLLSGFRHQCTGPFAVIRYRIATSDCQLTTLTWVLRSRYV